MKNKLFKYFCARMAIFAALSLLISALSISIVEGQTRTTEAKSAQPEAVFTNPAAITIVDNAVANPYPSTINVTGLTGTILTTPGSVKVTLNNFSHTDPEQIAMVLVGPTGAAFLIYDGATQADPASNITFSISDSGATSLPSTSPLASGTTYKPTAYFTGSSFPAPGPGTTYANPGPAGGGTATFASVFGGTNPNGNWNLFIRDFVEGDSGSISGGWSLEIAGQAQPFDNRLNYIGSGFSDWAVVTAVLGGNFTWTVARNDNPTPVNGRFFSIPFGLAAVDANTPRDLFTAFGDYTGDGLTDINVWRPGAQGLYWILPSNTTKSAAGGQAFTIPWGTTGDITEAEGDYDGDGKMDPTVIRLDSGAYRWFVLRTGTNTFSTFVFGANGDGLLAGADYTGDGADDPAVVRLTASRDILWLTGTTSGALINKVQWGNFNSDFIVPAGDYDGDSKADYVVWRGAGSAPSVNGEWFILRSTGGFSVTPWGIPGPGNTNPNRDLALRSGDYDNDKKTDIAVYRSSNQTFYVLRSSDGQLMQQKWGVPGSFPVAGFGVF